MLRIRIIAPWLRSSAFSIVGLFILMTPAYGPVSVAFVKASVIEDCHLTESIVPTRLSFPREITPGPDGNLWFTEPNAHRIGRITTAGIITEFELPVIEAPGGITTGPDGNLWFTTGPGNKIGRSTTSGAITLFPTPTFDSYTVDIAVGSDGNLWFTETNANKIGRITPAGQIIEFAVPTSPPAGLGVALGGITAGPDGALWFTEEVPSKIGRITTSGAITEFPVPTQGSGPIDITLGPDGNLWFAEFHAATIGRITPGGVITEFVHQIGPPIAITSGADGNIWFVDFGAIRRMSTSGEITKSCFIDNSFNGSFVGITAGPDGNMWVTQSIAFSGFQDKIVKLKIETPPLPSFDLCLKDDSNGNVLRLNSNSGDYQFTNCSGITADGIGSLTKRGSVITLQHNAIDRRVLARIDTSVNKGTGSVQLLSRGLTFTIADRNTANNICACSTP